MNMEKEMEKIGDIGLALLLRVSARGDGLYLFVPRDIVNAYGLMSGDRIEVKLGKIHRPKKRGGGEKQGE